MNHKDLNPYSVEAEKIQVNLAKLLQEERNVTQEVDSYEKTDRSAIEENLRKMEEGIKIAEREVLWLAGRAKEERKKAQSLSSEIGTSLNPANWLTRRKRSLRLIRKGLEESSKDFASKSSDLQDTISQMQEKARAMKTEIARHKDFNLNEKRLALGGLQNRIKTIKKKLQDVRILEKKVIDTIRPFMGEFGVLVSKRDEAQQRLQQAKEFSKSLDSAGDSYRRRKIHIECEEILGNGNPGRVCSQCHHELKALNRKIDKLRDRISDLTRNSVRTIDKIIIDGNNICYEGTSYIGLSALTPLVKNLIASYSVVVVFDSEIRNMLSYSDKELSGLFGPFVTTHAVALGQKADETILALAEWNDKAFVLSNDRFSDFPTSPAVKDRRVIRHELVDGNVFVHDLEIRIAYE